ncbi:hypothetical protein SAMN05216371_3415 [Streptomyces sp. TLI_053]|uniref:hypothetical protein n=1 Tax=Streptomyces sp. TLI_053 TaxID=1855352 RepID=UPI00087D012F|nr:hypothetical protein [Streptomyces sp. TLI_053]SDT65273.1 hypothetical protein SAMN05216371_3415 [Streptomyces sp. TLI_053]
MNGGTEFEERLGELLTREDTAWGAGRPEPAAVIAGARRRRARRRLGTGAAALAVALVCGGTALTVGDPRPAGGATGAAGAAVTTTAAVLPGAAPAASAVPAATGAGAQPDSPVQLVEPGKRLTIAEGYRMGVTATGSCVERWEQATGSWEQPFGCRDTTSDNLDHSRPTIGAQSLGDGERTVVTGLYLGPAAARVMVELNGVQVLATLVTTTEPNGWSAYYAVVPGAARSSSGPAGPDAAPSVAAWAADGTRLADLIAPRRSDPWATAGGGTGAPAAG